ncbi:HNH endonuclease [Rhodococcus aetherivorans]|uniref:HNH endonuclease n=1 Tax=Rhodococcus aetherivorans TaxID=191292 RepID=UPI003EBA3850
MQAYQHSPCWIRSLHLVQDGSKGLFYIAGHGVQTNATAAAEKLRTQVRHEPVSEYGRTRYGLTDDCHIWTGSKSPAGYGKVHISIPDQKRKGKNLQTHRLAYELAHGEGSALDLTIDHLCAVPLCCNPNHLEAVSIAENLRRAAERVLMCPAGHPYDDDNTHLSADGHRRCRQCNTDRYHIEVHGHAFVNDPTNASTKRRRCLVCREAAEAKPAYCPRGHEYTPENTRIDRGKRSCHQCSIDRYHIENLGHPFAADPTNPSTKRRRCLTCREQAPQVSHCIHGHELNETTLEYTPKGHRRCVLCALNARHVPKYNHEYVIDPNNPTSKRRCLVCFEAKQAEVRYCSAGHELTKENTYYRKNGWRSECRECARNREHRKRHGHDYLFDPSSTGLRVCLIWPVS